MVVVPEVVEVAMGEKLLTVAVVVVDSGGSGGSDVNKKKTIRIF